MIRSSHLLAALVPSLAVASTSGTASALGVLDVEIGGKLGYATSPSSSSQLGGNPLGFGVGGRVGLAFKGGPYLGGSFVAYPLGRVNDLARTGGAGGTQSTTTVLYGAELGWSLKLIELLTIRPQLGFGDASPIGNSPVGSTFWYLQPGVTGLVDLGTLFVGADVGMLLFADTNYEQAAFTFDAQGGLKF